MKNSNRTSNPGLLIMALLLVLLALVAVLVAVILATGNKGGNDPIQFDGTTTLTQAGITTPSVTTPAVNQTTPNTGSGNNQTTPNTGSGTTTQTTPQTTPTTTPSTGTPDNSKKVVSVKSSQKYEGALLVVGDGNELSYRTNFPKRSELIGNTSLQKELGFVNVKGSKYFKLPHNNHFLNKNAAEHFYKLAEAFAIQTGCDDLYMRNAYYCDYAEANPHANINATGYAVDLQIFDDNGKIFSLKSKREYYDWLIANCADYGFIFCKDTTEYSTFRYIGTAHATCMSTYNMTFEQYVDYIRNISADSYLRITDKDGVSWWIYYVPALSTESTDVTVYGNEECYEISGDNKGGFIVTINASKLAE